MVDPSSSPPRENETEAPEPGAEDRRRFLSVSAVAMSGGLAVSYGTLAWMAARFLHSGGGQQTEWQFVAPVGSFPLGEAVDYIAPSGAKVVIARQQAGDEPEDFVALSSVCPHLGCQVHWEPQNERFFCPCHNGAFDAQGQATEGPPAKAHQQLVRYRLLVEQGLLFIEAPTWSVDPAIAQRRPSDTDPPHERA